MKISIILALFALTACGTGTSDKQAATTDTTAAGMMNSMADTTSDNQIHTSDTLSTDTAVQGMNASGK